MTFERFKRIDVIAESIHDFDTQLNEALNMAIARACPKFKHMGQTLTLQTRVAMVASVKNNGYKNYHNRISDKLQMQQSSLFCSAITRYGEQREKKRILQSTEDFKRKRKHKIEAMIRELVLEKRTGLGDYGSGIALQLSDDEEEDQPAKKKGKTIKHCKWCDKVTNHKTWLSKHCVAHDQYIEWKNKKATNSSQNKQTKEKNEVRTLSQFLHHLSFLYLTISSLNYHYPRSTLQPVKNASSAQTEQKKVETKRATKVSTGTGSTEGKNITNDSTVCVKGGFAASVGVAVSVGGGGGGGGGGCAKDTVVRRVVAVAAAESPRVCSENSINDFGVNRVFEKLTNFSKTHVEACVRTEYESIKNSEKIPIIENLPKIIQNEIPSGDIYYDSSDVQSDDWSVASSEISLSD